MNLRIDERTKHRLTGLVVILAVAIIFVPAMIKKSNQQLEENMHLSVQLPPKPSTPKVAVAEKKAVFEAVKVAKMEVPTTVEPKRVSRLERVEGLQSKPVEAATTKPSVVKPVVAKAVEVPKPTALEEASISKEQSVVFTKVASNEDETPAAANLNPARVTTIPVKLKVEEAKSMSREAYAVQLASFAVQRNAENLVSRLRSQGYKAHYHTIKSDAGNFYKVTVGQLDARADARALQKKLSETTKIEGFIVKRDVG